MRKKQLFSDTIDYIKEGWNDSASEYVLESIESINKIYSDIHNQYDDVADNFNKAIKKLNSNHKKINEILGRVD